MPTSARSRTWPTRRARQKGVTLIELLIALSVLSMSALIAASAMNAGLPQSAVNQAAELLVSDLKRARLDAQKTGEDAVIKISPDSYELAGGEVRHPGRGVTLETDAAQREIAFSRSFAHQGGAVTVTKGGRRAVIIVHPITGKVERVE